MDSLNTLRAILVATAVLAFVVLLVLEYWIPAALIGLGITIHLVHFWHLYRSRPDPPLNV